MPRVDLTNVQESTGEYEMPSPGGYVLKITRMEPHPEKKYVFVGWDIAEGPMADHYKDSQWPPNDVMSYTENALGILKHKLHVLADDNPGFDAERAFNDDEWDAFRGKVFGAVLRLRLYTGKDGSDRTGIEIGRWYRTQEIRGGEFKPMPPRDTRDKTTPTVPQPPRIELADDDIPF